MTMADSDLLYRLAQTRNDLYNGNLATRSALEGATPDVGRLTPQPQFAPRSALESIPQTSGRLPVSPYIPNPGPMESAAQAMPNAEIPRTGRGAPFDVGPSGLSRPPVKLTGPEIRGAVNTALEGGVTAQPGSGLISRMAQKVVPAAGAAGDVLARGAGAIQSGYGAADLVRNGVTAQGVDNLFQGAAMAANPAVGVIGNLATQARDYALGKIVPYFVKPAGVQAGPALDQAMGGQTPEQYLATRRLAGQKPLEAPPASTAPPAAGPYPVSSWSPKPVAGDTSNVQAFVDQYGPYADQVAAKTGVSREAVLAHWGLETGWGKSIIPGTNNLGNIKDMSGGGVGAVDNATGQAGKYRAFQDPQQFADHYANLLQRKYGGTLNTGADSAAFAKGLAGYAEDKDYQSKLLNAIATVQRGGGAPSGGGPISALSAAPAAPAMTPEQQAEQADLMKKQAASPIAGLHFEQRPEGYQNILTYKDGRQVAIPMGQELPADAKAWVDASNRLAALEPPTPVQVISGRIARDVEGPGGKIVRRPGGISVDYETPGAGTTMVPADVQAAGKGQDYISALAAGQIAGANPAATKTESELAVERQKGANAQAVQQIAAEVERYKADRPVVVPGGEFTDPDNPLIKMRAPGGVLYPATGTFTQMQTAPKVTITKAQQDAIMKAKGWDKVRLKAYADSVHASLE